MPDLETVVNTTGLTRWEVIALIAVLILSTAVLCSWCFWRFFKKKRPKDKKKDGKKQVRKEAGMSQGLTGVLQDDEDFLVDNEEEMDIKEELEIKQDSRKEYLGKFQYKVHGYMVVPRAVFSIDVKIGNLILKYSISFFLSPCSKGNQKPPGYYIIIKCG